VKSERSRYASAIVSMARERQIVIKASRAFNLAGAAGFLWFLKRPIDVFDEGEVRAEFIEWLKGASDKEINQFAEVVPVYRRALMEEVDSDPVISKINVLSGDIGRVAWRQANKLAGFRAGTPQGKGGRPPAADWPAIEEELEREIAAVGFPHRNAEEGWRTIADVVKWIEPRLGKSEPSKTALKENVSKMIEPIRARRAGKSFPA